MSIVLRNLVGVECFVFVNDLVIFSKTPEEHALRLENILWRLEGVNLQLQPGKCVFAQPKGQYLGYVLWESGVSTSLDKVKAMKHYPTPKCAKDISGTRFILQKISSRFCQNSKTPNKTDPEKPGVCMGH